MKKFLTFIFAIVVSFIPCVIGLFFTPNGASNMWYNALTKSALTPAGWVFGVAWGILYLLLGIALFLVINNTRTRVNKGRAYTLFVIQMILNALWSYVFFGANLMGFALITLSALLVVAVLMARSFWQISVGAFWLTVPYIAWLIFALYLNGVIIMAN